MNEHPILFSRPMVQANLEDRKSMTRRTIGLNEINEHPEDFTFLRVEYNPDKIVISPTKYANVPKNWRGAIAIFHNKKTDNYHIIKCQYGQPGDLLWVRETWINTFIPHCVPVGGIYYRADHPEQKHLRWRSPLHMLKTDARIWLQVTEIRVERLQDISEEDAIAEGIEIDETGYYKIYDKKPQNLSWTDSPKVSFMSLIQLINGEEIWKQNPWVWVVKYKVLSKTGKPSLP